MSRNRYEVAPIVVRPIVIRTNKLAGVTILDLADPASSMGTNVCNGVELTFFIQTKEERHRPSVGLNEVTVARELASVPQVEPTSGEYSPLFECKNIRIRKYTTADRAVVDVDEGPGHAFPLYFHCRDEAIPEEPLFPKRRKNLTRRPEMFNAFVTNQGANFFGVVFEPAAPMHQGRED